MTKAAKPVLILQLRPEDEASVTEYQAFLDKGGLTDNEAVRHRLEAAPLPDKLSLDDYSAVIVGGGPGCVSDDPATRDPSEARAEAEILALLSEIVDRDVPFLGCCAGIGILAHYLGGDVSKARYGEPVGAVTAAVTPDDKKDPLLQGLPDRFDVLVGHKEAAQEVPKGAVHLMSAPSCPVQMIRVKQNIYATQFHPEADGQVFADRIRIYKDRGYFAPEDAAALTNAVLATQINQPERILRRFVERFVKSKTPPSA